MSNSGLICTKSSQPVPLKSINVIVNIHDFIACVVSTLEYVNQEDSAIEAEFVFPMDDDSAVFKFEVKIDGRVIIGECQEKEQAKATYKQAMDSGYGAFMLRESDQSGDIFQMNVGNLPAGKKAVVTFSYVLNMTVSSDGLCSYKMPTILNPRYSPKVGVVEKIFGNYTPSYFAGSNPPYSLNFTAVIKGSKVVTAVKCPAAAIIQDTQRDGSVQVKLRDKFRFDRDLELLVKYADSHKSTALLGIGDTQQNGLLKQQVAMVNIFPSVKTDVSTNKMEFVFVVDRSGSMRGDKIQHTRDALLLFLKSLPMGCYFNIISFGSDFSVLFPNGSKMYNQDTLNEALALQSGMDADMGGTEILRPLTYMYTEMKVIPGYARQVFVLTDGEVSNTKSVINLIEKNSDNARMFTFGIGHGASTSLVKGMANAGKGKAVMVTGKDRLQSKVISSLKMSMQGVITDIKLDWELPDGLSVVNIPEICPAIYFNEHFVSYAVFQGQTQNESVKVTLSATVGDLSEVMKETVDLNLNNGCRDDNFSIHRLAAKEQIKALESQKQADPIEVSDSESSTKEKVLLLSLATNIVSQYTAFVGVDKETREVTCYKRPIPSQSNFPGLSAASCMGYARHIQKCSMRQQMGRQRSLFSAPCKPKAVQCSAPSTTTMGILPASSAQARLQLTAQEVEGVIDMMEVKVDKTLERDQKLSLLDEKCENLSSAGLSSQSKTFYRSSKSNSGMFVRKLSSAASAISSIWKPQRQMNAYCNDFSSDSKNDDDIMKIILLQSLEGSWDLTNDLKSVLGTDGQEFRTRTNISDEQVIATVHVISWLEKNHQSRKDEWCMIVDKAIQWLKTQDLQGNSVEDLKNTARKFVK